MSFNERIRKLNEVQRGWVNNFRMASIQNKLNELDGWLRNRLRYCIWHHWKKPERKRKNLIRLGVEQGQAYAWSRSRMGGWAIAQSPILGTTITVDRLKKRGYVSLLEIYRKISPQLNEPLLTRPVRGVRGALAVIRPSAVYSTGVSLVFIYSPVLNTNLPTNLIVLPNEVEAKFPDCC